MKMEHGPMAGGWHGLPGLGRALAQPWHSEDADPPFPPLRWRMGAKDVLGVPSSARAARPCGTLGTRALLPQDRARASLREIPPRGHAAGLWPVELEAAAHRYSESLTSITQRD